MPAAYSYAPAVAICCLLAAGLRLYKLAAANPWWDEGFTYWLASQDLPGMLLRTAGDTHPPLSYLLYQLWMPPAGREIFALRYLSVVFGVLAVPACAAAARRAGGRRAGLVAALLLAVAPFHVWWSQQIRMYALVALLCALSMWLLLRLVDKRAATRGTLLAWCLVNLAGLYTLYFFAVLLLLEGMLLGAMALKRRALLAPLLGLILTPLPLLPWLAYFRQHAIRFAPAATAPLSWGEFLRASWGELALGIDTGVQALAPLLVAMAAITLALLALLLACRSSRGLALWLAVVAAGLPLAAYGITLQRGLFFSPAYQTRYDLPALPALVILLAWGMSRLPRPAAIVPLLLFAGAAGFGLTRLYDARHRTDDYQSLARMVEAYGRPGDAIVFDPDWNFHLFLLVYRGSLPWEAFPLNQRVDAAYAAQQLGRWSEQYRALWLLQEAGGHDAGAEHPVRDWLVAHLHPTLRLAVGDRLLVLYERPDAPERRVNSGFHPQFDLRGVPGVRGYDEPVDSLRPGDVLHLAVYGEGARSLVFDGRTVDAQQFPGRSDFAIPIGPAVSGPQRLLLETSTGAAVPLRSVRVEPRTQPPPATELPPLPRPAGQAFGAAAVLTSYDVQPGNPVPGQNLTVTLQWRALAPLSQNYTVFVHLLDGADRVVAQRDSQPAGGRRPTVTWAPGLVFNDAYVLALPASLPRGRYRLELGLYLQATGERLRLAGGDDRLLLGPVEIS